MKRFSINNIICSKEVCNRSYDYSQLLPRKSGENRFSCCTLVCSEAATCDMLCYLMLCHFFNKKRLWCQIGF